MLYTASVLCCCCVALVAGLPADMLLYRLRADRVRNSQVPSDKAINHSMVCSDLQQAEQQQQNILFEGIEDLVSQVAQDGEPVDYAPKDGGRLPTVALPASLVVRMCEDVAPKPDSEYYARHLALIARLSSGTNYSVAVQPNGSWAVTVVASEYEPRPLGDGLTLLRVPDYCEAMLSDADCVRNSRISTMPHRLSEIGDCVFALQYNMARFHEFRGAYTDFKLPLSLANPCLSLALERFHLHPNQARCLQQRTVDNESTCGSVRVFVVRP